ncbi:hypothetical protein CDIK_0851 [Cucumispora dikerogammari]|nr:hypothetical protein CDIK_0851 [Cucumispora dikerogammari]
MHLIFTAFQNIKALDFYLYNKGQKAFLTVYDNVKFSKTPFTKFTEPARTSNPNDFSLIMKEEYFVGKNNPGPDKILFTEGSTDLFRNVDPSKSYVFDIINDEKGTIFKNRKGECFTADSGSPKIAWKPCDKNSDNQIWKYLEENKGVYMWEKMLKIDQELKETMDKDRAKSDVKIKEAVISGSTKEKETSPYSKEVERGLPEKDGSWWKYVNDLINGKVPPNKQMPPRNKNQPSEPNIPRDFLNKIDKIAEALPKLQEDVKKLEKGK